jgi:hypothetical protein
MPTKDEKRCINMAESIIEETAVIGLIKSDKRGALVRVVPRSILLQYSTLAEMVAFSSRDQQHATTYRTHHEQRKEPEWWLDGLCTFALK